MLWLTQCSRRKFNLYLFLKSFSSGEKSFALPVWSNVTGNPVLSWRSCFSLSFVYIQLSCICPGLSFNKCHKLWEDDISLFWRKQFHISWGEFLTQVTTVQLWFFSIFYRLAFFPRIFLKYLDFHRIIFSSWSPSSIASALSYICCLKHLINHFHSFFHSTAAHQRSWQT